MGFGTVSASTYLNSSVILNTTVSHTSVTFSIPVTVDSYRVENTSITLNGLMCIGTGFYDSVRTFSIPNSNTDSASYCASSSRPNSCAQSDSKVQSTLAGLALWLPIFLLVVIFGVAGAIYMGVDPIVTAIGGIVAVFLGAVILVISIVFNSIISQGC